MTTTQRGLTSSGDGILFLLALCCLSLLVCGVDQQFETPGRSIIHHGTHGGRNHHVMNGGGDGSPQMRNAKKRSQEIKQKDKPIITPSVPVYYPLTVIDAFTSGVASDKMSWKQPGVYSAELAAKSSGKPYKQVSSSQEQEDLWLYENWFYGMSNGVIMESGALDGVEYSVSHMFEKFANWNVIHVGKLKIKLLS